MRTLCGTILAAAVCATATCAVAAAPVNAGYCGTATWISGDTLSPEKSAPVLFRAFELSVKPPNAVFTVAVAGWCEVYVNGEKVGKDVLSPVTCQPDKRLSSVAYDVTSFLKKGENVVEVLLGNGWFNCFTKDVWGFSSAPWLGAPKVCGELVADGKTLLVTDGSWTVRDSPIVFNALRNGEYYDARREGSRANVRAVKVEAAPAMAVSPEDAVPCRAFDPISPVRSFPAGNGGTIYDFGSNRTGWCEIEVVGEAGSKVTIDYDECLTPANTLLGDIGVFIRCNNDPRPAQHDEYTLAGKEGGERWHPRFTYHGFRYAQVRTEGKVELKSIKSVFVHSDFDSVGSFKISDSVFGKLQDATRRSYLSNFTGIPTDCPHREKNGWTGDAQLAMETGLWNFDAKAGYVHFLRMMLDEQKPDGKVPRILPSTDKFGYSQGSGPAWDAILFEVPWQIYRFYGDDAPAREAYPAMKKYLSFIGGKARSDGLVEHGLGDWCAPTGVKVAPVLLTDSAYVYEFNRRVAFWAERFGEGDVAAECRAKAAKVKASFNKEFYKGGGVYADGELTSLAAPLYFKGLCADGEERKVVGELLRRLRENGHKAKFGILGAKWIPRVLAGYGYIDDAWRIFTQPDAPGWAIWMKDNDTLLESFDDRAGGTPVSHNHIMFGDLSAWAFEYIAGIKIDEPGFAKFHVEPHLPDGVESFEAEFRTTCGRKIRVRAWREGGEAKYDTAIANAQPFSSVEAARDAARTMPKPAVVHLAAGVHRLEKPLVLTPEDSGVTYVADGGVVISGSRPVTDWRVEADGTWSAPVPWVKANRTDGFRSMRVNGAMRPRARLPKKGHFTIVNDDLPEGERWNVPRPSFFYDPKEFNPEWANLKDAEIVCHHFWVDTHLRIASVDAVSNKVTFVAPARVAFDTGWSNNKSGGLRGIYAIENLPAAMTEPGEWWLEYGAGRVHYRPMPGETPETAKVEVPFCPALVSLKGTPEKDGRYVEDVVFRGIRFELSQFELSERDVNNAQGSATVSVAVRLVGARRCRFEDCAFEDIGGYAVDILKGSRENVLSRCAMTRLGAGGVRLDGGLFGYPAVELNVSNVVEDCEIGPYGLDFRSAVGVFLKNAARTRIVHNHIHDGYYTGVSAGWVWGYHQSASRENEISHNHIHDIGKGLLSDMGGIYTLGPSGGTRIANNRIHGVNARSYGGWGIYQDEGSTGILVENNVVYDTKFAPYDIHYAKAITVRNNIFAFGKKDQVARTRCEPHVSCELVNNIFYWTEGDLYSGNWNDIVAKSTVRRQGNDQKTNEAGLTVTFKADRNVYFNPMLSVDKVKFGGGRSFDAWRKMGKDINSVYADPLFKDAAGRDFRLKPESPAFKMGFVDFDQSDVGPSSTSVTYCNK